jgi:hypothetical protein
MIMQNKNPGTFEELSKILDDYNRIRGIKPIDDEMSQAACSRLRKLPNDAMNGFSAGNEARQEHERMKRDVETAQKFGDGYVD